MSDNHRIPKWHGIPRDEIPWWPIVESCKCDGCGLCITSCPTEALSFDFKLGIPFIHALHRCIVGCTICATLCPQEAFVLPEREEIQTLISNRRLPQTTRREIHQYRNHYAGVLPAAIYPNDVSHNQN